MKVTVFDLKGKETKKIDLDGSVFNAEANEKVISQYVYAYLANQRQANAHTKDRSEVRGGGRKPWRQKGTGRARFGSSRNPIWRKGGVTFGPRNNRNWKKALNRKFVKSAMRSALSSLGSDNLKVIIPITFDDKKPLTKQALEIVEAFGYPSKITIVTNEKNEVLLKACANLSSVKATRVQELNAYDILNSGMLMLDEESIKILEDKLKK